MADYIRRDIVLQIINTVNDTGGFAGYADYCTLFDEIDTMPASDVQPFKWVRCEESLPVYDGLVLVADRDNNIRLGIFTETGWLSQFGNPMIPRPKAWAKIPELPETIKG